MSIEAIKQMVHELEYVLDCINNNIIPFDGDDFHEALRLGRQALAQSDQEPDDLTIAYMTGFHAGKNTPQRKPEQEFFVVKHYSADERPTIKGNGFDGLEVGTDREDAEKFIAWVNARISTPPKREWVGLTGPEVVEAYRSVSDKEWAIGGLDDARVFFCAIEAKLREKNT